MSDGFDRAKTRGGKPGCPKCRGAGVYVYTTHGTPHSTVCDLCCPHDAGWWLLQKYYGENNGKWCCRGGCGKVIEKEPA